MTSPAAIDEVVLACPECGTRFRVPARALAPEGRTVKCSQCGHRWFAEPPASETAREAEPTAEEAAVQEAPAAAAPAAPRSMATVAGWLLVVLLLLLVAAVVVGRDEIAARWPQAAKFYARIGLPVSVPLGLEIRNLRAERTEEDGMPLLLVRGEVYNVSGSARLVPPLKVTLFDAQGRQLDFGLYEAEKRRLAEGEITRFEARLLDPPANAERFEVTFTDRPRVE